ncbi:MAG: DnaD domain protein [Clostridiales bacterium]|nr:DnaD domain protein [Clostridiales bacterium]
MAWIELHQTLPSNKKTIRLKKLLKIKTPQAIGHLCLLWLWALDNAQDGDLSDFSPDEIAEIMEWTGKDPQQLINALIESGFLDDSMNIHNWHEYTGRLIEKRKTDAERKRSYRRKSESCPQDVQGTTDGFPRDGAGNRTIPYLTNSSSCSNNSARTREGKEPDEDVSRVMDYYMDKINATPSSASCEELLNYIPILGADVVIKAMSIALDEHKPQWSYIRGILRSWTAQGVKSLVDVQRLQNELDASKIPRDKPKNGGNMNAGNAGNDKNQWSTLNITKLG